MGEFSKYPFEVAHGLFWDKFVQSNNTKEDIAELEQLLSDLDEKPEEYDEDEDDERW